MARRQNARTGIYDIMEEKGIFDENPANVQSPEFTEPFQYPKMLYHPKGEERIIRPAEMVDTPVGPKAVSEQKELIHIIVENEEQEKAYRDEGWWDHPSLANKAAGRTTAAPLGKSQTQRILELEKELAQLKGANAKPAPLVVTSKT